MDKRVANPQELLKIMNEHDARKATEPDGVVGWISLTCTEQMGGSIHDFIISSLDAVEGTVNLEGATVVSIYKGNNKKDSLNYQPESLISVVCKFSGKNHYKILVSVSGTKYQQGNLNLGKVHNSIWCICVCGTRQQRMSKLCRLNFGEKHITECLFKDFFGD